MIIESSSFLYWQSSNTSHLEATTLFEPELVESVLRSSLRMEESSASETEGNSTPNSSPDLHAGAAGEESDYTPPTVAPASVEPKGSMKRVSSSHL